MKLNKNLAYLLKNLEYTILQGKVEGDVTAVVNDSRKACEGCLFFCIPGARVDGHDFAQDVVARGAKVLVVMRPVEVPEHVTVIQVADARYAMAFISAAYFDHPASKLKTIGITGTKGKTTTTYLVKSILEKTGLKVGLVGTIEIIIGDTHIHAANTTPESYTLQEYFARMVDAGMDAVVMEVSSQGLMLHRTQGFVFDYGIFTNMEPDHIGPDEHASFEDYMACKGLLFKQCRIGIVNGDDSHVETVINGHTCSIERYGFGESNDLRAVNTRLVKTPGRLGAAFDIKGKYEMSVEIATPGMFSIYNALTA
ncbi:MAG: UDP-N-acetylmuramoyl-L-alanyl-D-glutamate--2,6-diaminopimelate ligase, partial [Lachnospiraceae bacterium]|nr:UDP-N-acetylmuramoyl-L-alanyl-D-glutamate--2,6-diaminopimelate ligase [Lachnospiraceae bacterium]